MKEKRMTYYKFVYNGATRKSFVHIDAGKAKIREEINNRWGKKIDLNDIEIIMKEEYERIKPCRYCEGVAELYSNVNSEQKNRYCYGCSICGNGPFIYYCTEEEALAQWNEWANIEA